MSIRNYFKWASLIVILLILVMPSTFLKAADTQGIQISPTTYNYEIKPGESQSGKIILKNLNSNILNYVIEVEGFSKASDEGAPSFAIDSSAGCISSVSSWFFFKDEKGQIPAGQQREIPFTVSVPKDAEPGGHYAAIFAKEVKEAAKGKSQLGISSRVGTLILIAVPGDVKMGAEITEFKTPRFVWNGSISFAMKVKNTGTVHYDSVGSVKIKSLVSKESKFELATHTILPQNSRNYEKNWTKKYPFGYYKITPIATDGNKQEISASTVTVIAIPLVIVIPILVLLILIILTISYLRKHLRFVNGQNKVPPTNNPPSIQA